MSSSKHSSSAGANRRKGRASTGQSIVFILLLWAFIFNIVVKEKGAVVAFFEIIDTITENLVMGSIVTVLMGLGIVSVFTITKLYTQIISKTSSFRILESIVIEEVANGKWKEFFRRLLHFEGEPEPDEVVPEHLSSILISLSLLYLVSWVYVLLFSEALFFVSWSAGVDLPISVSNIELLPTLALAIPFSARVMAYLRYPYAQDYADFMPGAVFVLLLVGSLGYLFHSDDQQFFLLRVWHDQQLLREFLRSGLTLAFVPVFSESLFWLVDIFLHEETE